MTTKNPAAVALGKLGGSRKSERKAAASRENGKRGGRPIQITAKAHTALANCQARKLQVADSELQLCENAPENSQ